MFCSTNFFHKRKNGGHGIIKCHPKIPYDEKKLKANSGGQPECSDPVKEMMKTTTTTTSAQKPRWKWSGDDEPQSCYCHEDNDTGTLTVDEQRRIQWYHTNAKRKWHNADEDEHPKPKPKPKPKPIGYTNTKTFKQGAQPAQPAPLTAEEQAARHKKQEFIEAQKKETEASNAAFMAAYRAAHPVPEMPTGSPYQTAREAWINGQEGTDGALDHWTSSK